MDRHFENIVFFVAIDMLVQTYADDGGLAEGKIDVAKLKLLPLDMAGVKYRRLGPAVGKCWNVGKTNQSPNDI